MCSICKFGFKDNHTERRENHVKKHFEKAVIWKQAPIFECTCTSRSSDHYHCPECDAVRTDKSAFIKHMNRHLQSVSFSSASPVAPVAPPVVAPKPTPSEEFDTADNVEITKIIEITGEDDSDSEDRNFRNRKRRYECVIESCGKTYEYPSLLSRHEVSHSSTSINANMLKSALVDVEDQIYLVRVTVKGSDYKVHVNLRTETCRSRDCLRSDSNNETLICRHVRAPQIGTLPFVISIASQSMRLKSLTLSESAKNAVMGLKILPMKSRSLSSLNSPKTRVRSGTSRYIQAIPRGLMSDPLLMKGMVSYAKHGHAMYVPIFQNQLHSHTYCHDYRWFG